MASAPARSGRAIGPQWTRARAWTNPRTQPRAKQKEPAVTAHPPPSDELDPRLIDFAREVFDTARRGEAATLASLIDQGLPPNLRNEKGDSLVMLASYHGHANAVRALVQRGADPDLRNDNGQTPLAGAAFKGYAEVISALLDNGADVEGASPDGRTALMIAAMFNRVDIVDQLLSRGANPRAQDGSGNTAFDVANGMGATDAAARLAHASGRTV
jgi:ankyrin repeat protein